MSVNKYNVCGDTIKGVHASMPYSKPNDSFEEQTKSYSLKIFTASAALYIPA